ncbi:hypothetical protein FPCIR_13022 [Fusarium pseudocircinatum]|uniref:CCHC-type domain-containing protein n=1 Tax=Fusarium pseudocircinatum TaxID=56676 RepID=A0A8H5NQT8_9HYPO|nr:hypothetical protein FPCIR_13022 [Fusarium pseudocircinatum]
MEPSKSSQTSKGVADNPEFQALMQGFAANLASFLDNALPARSVKAEPSNHVKADPSGSLLIDLTQHPRIKDEKADSHSHGQMVIDLTAEPGTDVDASFKDNDLFAEDDAELPLAPSTKFPLPSKSNLLSGSARDTKASSTRPSVRDKSKTESQQSSMSSASVLRTANVDMDDDYVPNDDDDDDDDNDDENDDDSDGGEKRRRLAARHLKVGKRSQAASASLSSRLPLPHATGGRKTGDSAHQNLGDAVADFNAIDSDEDFLTYNTVLVRASHDHKALVRAELEKPYMVKWVKEAKDTAPGFAGTNNRAHITVKHLYESDSHEAVVVILDLVRTAKNGFIAKAPCMNVGTTRSRLGQFIIGPSKKVPLEWPLNHLVNYLEERKAVINLKDRYRWYMMPQNCCQPGHLATDCRFKPKCARCDGAPHATRNCPRAEEDAISTSASEPITAEDGIQRDVLNPPWVNFSNSKRSKKNTAIREDAFAKPDKHKDTMRKDFRQAMRGLRDVKKGQGINEYVETDEQDQSGDDGADDGFW